MPFSQQFDDQFSRADGPVGDGWNDLNGKWSISSDTLKTTSTAYGSDLILRPTSESLTDQRADLIVTLGAQADGNGPGTPFVWLRTTTDKSGYAAWLGSSPGGTTLAIAVFTGGSLVSAPAGPTPLTGLTVGADYLLSFSAVGTTLTVTIASASTPGTILSTTTLTDSTHASGVQGVGPNGLSANIVKRFTTDSTASPTPPPTPSIGDPSFEQVSVGSSSGKFMSNPTGSAWTFSAAPTQVGLLSNGSGYGNPNAPDGSQAAFLQGVNATISQSVPSWTAGSYQITLQAAQRLKYTGAPGDSAQDFNVLVDGAVAAHFQPPATTYGPLATPSFTVAAGSHTIAFTGLNTAGGDNTCFIDQVAVVAGGSATPTPVPAPAPALTATPITVLSTGLTGWNLQANTTGGAGGNHYQWQSSSTPDGPFSNVVGATGQTQNFQVASGAAPLYVRCVVTDGASTSVTGFGFAAGSVYSGSPALPFAVVPVADPYQFVLISDSTGTTALRFDQSTFTNILAGAFLPSTVTLNNQAISGTTVQGWDASLLASMIANLPPGKYIFLVDLGVNDSKSTGNNSGESLHLPVSAWSTHVASICRTILGTVKLAGSKVVLMGPGYVAAPTQYNQWDDTSVSLLLQYCQAIPALCDGTTILNGMTTQRFYSFAANPTLFADGVHETVIGGTDLATMYSAAVIGALTGPSTTSPTPTPVPIPTGPLSPSGATFARLRSGGLSGQIESLIAANPTLNLNVIRGLHAGRNGTLERLYQGLAGLVEAYLQGDPIANSDVNQRLADYATIFSGYAQSTAEIAALVGANPGTIINLPSLPHAPVPIVERSFN